MKLALVLNLFIFSLQVFGQCTDLAEMVERINGMKPGHPIKVSSVRGNTREGVIENVFEHNGRKVVSIRRPDGKVESLFVDQLDPASFRAPMDNLNPGQRFSVKSKSGNTYEGEVIGRSVRGGKSHIKIRKPDGQEVELNISRLDEGSLRITRPVQSPGNNVMITQKKSSFDFPDGTRVGTDGDAQFISLVDDGTGQRLPGRVLDIQQDKLSGQVYLRVEVQNPSTGVITTRVLKPSEIGSVRLSNTSKTVFAGRAKPSPLPVVADAPPAKFTTAQRSANIDEAFGTGHPTATAPPQTMNSRINPNTGNRANFFNDINFRNIAVRNGKIFDDVPISSLPKGKSYTFVITEDGRMSFGMIDDAWEVGVKHMHIANGRPVMGAGEIKVLPNGKIEYNTMSGTFTRQIVAKNPGITDELMEKRIRHVLTKEMGPGNVTRGGDNLFPVNGPTSSDLRALCQQSEFLSWNKHFCP
jgi:hypothetical protein